MKKIAFTCLLIMSSYGLFAWVPEPTEANGPQDVLMCYHVVDGVRDTSPYTMIPVGATCPPCSSNSSCLAAHKAEDQKRKYETPEVPPHLCSEEALPDWY